MPIFLNILGKKCLLGVVSGQGKSLLKGNCVLGVIPGNSKTMLFVVSGNGETTLTVY